MARRARERIEDDQHSVGLVHLFAVREAQNGKLIRRDAEGAQTYLVRRDIATDDLGEDVVRVIGGHGEEGEVPPPVSPELRE